MSQRGSFHVGYITIRPLVLQLVADIGRHRIRFNELRSSSEMSNNITSRSSSNQILNQAGHYLANNIMVHIHSVNLRQLNSTPIHVLVLLRLRQRRGILDLIRPLPLKAHISMLLLQNRHLEDLSLRLPQTIPFSTHLDPCVLVKRFHL